MSVPECPATATVLLSFDRRGRQSQRGFPDVSRQRPHTGQLSSRTLPRGFDSGPLGQEISRVPSTRHGSLVRRPRPNERPVEILHNRDKVLLLRPSSASKETGPNDEIYPRPRDDPSASKHDGREINPARTDHKSRCRGTGL